MTAREIKVLEDTINYWEDARASGVATDSTPQYLERVNASIYVLLDLITNLHLKYKKERVTKKLITTEYTTTHYTLYTD